MSSVLSIIVALLLDQLKPFDGARWLSTPLNAFAHQLERWFDAGEYRQGVIAWIIGVIAPTLMVGLIWWGLYTIFPLLGWIWNVVCLYVILEFKKKITPLQKIMRDLDGGEIEVARQDIADWSARDLHDAPEEVIVAQTVDTTLKSTFKNVFAPIFWYAILPGPMGLVLYRLSLFFRERWGERVTILESELFGRFSNQVVFILEWIPKYLVAASFALVGNFEDVVYCCRRQAKAAESEPLWPILSAGAGAIGILFYGLSPKMTLIEYGIRDNPEPSHLQALVGLFWRALFIWLLVMALLSLVFS